MGDAAPVKMRVALVLPSRSDPAHRRVARELGEALAGRGHAVFRFPPKDGIGDRRARALFEALLRRESIDVCHVQFFSRGLGYLAGARFPRSVRLILTSQGAGVGLLRHPLVFRGLARRAAWVTAVSSRGLQELGDHFPEIRGKTAVVANGAALAPPAAGPGRRRPYALCVSRLAAYKGIDLLAMAFAGMPPAPRGLDLVVCGPDQTAGRLAVFIERLGLKGKMRLLGPVSARRVAGLVAGCRFFVLPSRQENLPMALLEAMAAGKAVIASAAGGVPELIENGVAGLLVEPGDVEGLRKAMAVLSRDAALRRRLGKRARARAGEFSWPRIAAGYERLYVKALKASPAGASPARTPA